MITNWIARSLFENNQFCDPLWAALVAGYAMIGPDGIVYLTREGAEYLEGCE